MNKRAWIFGVAAVLIGTGSAAAADGKAVYERTCKGCHSVLAPRAGDKTAWAPLIKKGAAALAATVMKGKGPMPPKGGAASAAEVKAAVEYLISQAK